MNESKPKVFEEIDNHIADIKATVAFSMNESEYRDELLDTKVGKL